MSMCDFSACGRAVYDYVNDCWQPMPQLENLSGFDRDTRSFAEQEPLAPKQSDVRADLERLLSVESPEPTREVTRFGLSAEQIGEVQQRLSGLQPGAISSVKRIRENSRLLREQAITQANLAELFDYLGQTGAIEWLASDHAVSDISVDLVSRSVRSLLPLLFPFLDLFPWLPFWYLPSDPFTKVSASSSKS